MDRGYEDQGRVDFSLIAITPRSILTWSGSTS